MTLVLTGLSYKTAPVEVRERLAFPKDAMADALCALVDGEVVREGMILSTCNRVELLAELNPARAAEGEARLADFLASRGGLAGESLSRHVYTHCGEEAVRHLFRVAASLDSMVLGEPQILGQVRQAYADACEAGAAGKTLHRLLHHTFHAAKRIRSETDVAACAVSVSYAAVELGRKILGTFEGRTVLLVGAGEMAELAARHLVKNGAARILVANRTRATAERLAAEFGGQAVPYEHFATFLAEADVVICSTGARRHVVTAEMARAALALRRNRPSFFIDISVPRNVDPRVAEIGNLFVFDVDDLEAVVASNLREREREAVRAASIVATEVALFTKALRELELGPAVGALKARLRRAAEDELARERERLGDWTPEQERAAERLLDSTVNKLSHPLIQRLRRAAEASDARAVGGGPDGFGLDCDAEIKARVRAALADAFNFRTGSHELRTATA